MNRLHTSTRNKRRPFIKVCGQTYTGSVDCSAAYGAEYIGFNFCKGSNRRVTPLHAAQMNSCLVKRVGVFDAQGAEEVCCIMQQARLHLAQLQGHHTPAEGNCIGASRVIRTLRVQPGETVAAVQAEVDAWAPACCAFVVECGNAALLRRVRFPHPWLLSGRMNPALLGRMLHLCRPHGVDIESGWTTSETLAALRAII